MSAKLAPSGVLGNPGLNGAEPPGTTARGLHKRTWPVGAAWPGKVSAWLGPSSAAWPALELARVGVHACAGAPYPNAPPGTDSRFRRNQASRPDGPPRAVTTVCDDRQACAPAARVREHEGWDVREMTADAHPDDDRVPTATSEPDWIWARNPHGAGTDTPYCGKWLLFLPEQYVDERWAIVAQATRDGLLGTAAKVASKGAARPYRPGEPIAYLCCVYTRDCRDVADVARVLAALRELGFARRLSYKEDNATLSFRYGTGAALYVAQQRSRELSQRRPIMDPPTCLRCGAEDDGSFVFVGIGMQCPACLAAAQKSRRSRRKHGGSRDVAT